MFPFVFHLYVMKHKSSVLAKDVNLYEYLEDIIRHGGCRINCLLRIKCNFDKLRFNTVVAIFSASESQGHVLDNVKDAADFPRLEDFS